MLEKVQQDRLKKLESIRELGIDPYGGRYATAEAIAAIRERYQEDTEGQTADAAGRLILIRDMGRMIFAHIRDESGQMQIALRKNALDETGWKLSKLLDLGDIIAVAGPLQRTKTDEPTIWAERLTLLCKSLNPMPEKFHGLVDVETRYRQRYLDLMTNPESMGTFRKRIAIIEHFRTKLAERGFVEVETPTMQTIYGGAAARPFVTHHNTLDVDLFLRISPELYLKRLLVGGMERVYEFARVFRNEGIDTSHSPEYTLFELYQAYADYNVMMEITEELISTAAEQIARGEELHEKAEAFERRARELLTVSDGFMTDIAGLPSLSIWELLTGLANDKGIEPTTENVMQIAARYSSDAASMVMRTRTYQEAADLRDKNRIALPYGNHVLDYTLPWRRAKYADLLSEHAGVDMGDEAGVRAKARELGIEDANKDAAVVIDEVFEQTVEPHLVQPTFVIDYPAALCPLTRRKADDPTIAERFEPYVANMELGNAYTELNDPTVQEANFRQQLRGEAENETMRIMDEDFITALRHGMPPAGGLGIGIDRVVMLLTDTQSIRDVILFPMLRPEAKNE